MTADLPEVFAVVPLIPNVLPLAQALYSGQYVDPEEVADFALKTQPIHLKRLDDPSKPFIKTDKNGNKTLFLLWGHPKNYMDINYLVSMTCPLTQDRKGQDMFKPSLMMRGPRANVMVIGGMSCCSALQTHWSQVFSDGKLPLDDARIPVTGLSSPEHGNWLKGKIHIPTTEHGLSSLHHMAMDMMAHHFPDEARFRHNCGAETDYLNYGNSAQTLAPK